MSRRQSIPANVFYRKADPMPPLFPAPFEGDIYFNTIRKVLRIFHNNDADGDPWEGVWQDLFGGGNGNGGPGPGGGNTRKIIVQTTSTTAENEASTDYVYLCGSATAMTLNLPDATLVSTNMYTVKRTGTGAVTVAAGSGQTIDGVGTFALSPQYQSIDLFSNGSNWSIV